MGYLRLRGKNKILVWIVISGYNVVENYFICDRKFSLVESVSGKGWEL